MSPKFQSIILGGLITAILGSALGIGAQSSQVLGILACCFPGIVGALISVWHYTTNNALTLTSGEGAGVGALTGLIGYLLTIPLSFILSMVGIIPSPFDTEAQIQAARDRFQDQLDSGQISQEQFEQMVETTAQFATPTMILGFMALALVVYAVIGAAGGAIGASMFKKGGPIEEEL